MSKMHYCLAPVRVYEGGVLATAIFRALVSRRGIYRVFEESESIRKAFLEARVFSAIVDSEILRARLVRETGPEGTHYNLKLLDVGADASLLLEERLQKTGFAAPWQRRFPRIPVSAAEGDAEIPVGVLVTRVTGKMAGEVRNFSHHGMLFELRCSGPSIGEYVGQQISFRVLTSRGALLDECEASVARIYDEVVGRGHLLRGLGVKFEKMPDSARKAYQSMILEFCHGWKNNQEQRP